MSEPVWSAVDGTVSVSSETRIRALLEDAHARGMHLGTRAVHHATIQDALDANDAAWSHRLVVAPIEAMRGELTGPNAPRAAVGPDLACFALGTRNAVRSTTLRAEQAVAWGRAEVPSVEKAVVLAMRLTERGCTLVEIRGKELFAALPRKSLVSLIDRSDAPPLVEEPSHATWSLPWRIVPEVLPRLRDEVGELALQALDPHLCVVRVVGKTAPERAVLRAAMTRHLGITQTIPPDVSRALRIRPLETGRPRA